MTDDYGISVTSRKTKLRHYRKHSSETLRYTGRMKLRIKEIRKQKNLTQKDVAEAASLSPSYFADLERGDSPINSIRLEAIAKAMGVDPAELIAGSDDPKDAQMREDFNRLAEGEKEIVRQMVASLSAKGK